MEEFPYCVRYTKPITGAQPNYDNNILTAPGDAPFLIRFELHPALAFFTGVGEGETTNVTPPQ